jgi:rhodanese-related sulfurtransferase
MKSKRIIIITILLALILAYTWYKLSIGNNNIDNNINKAASTQIISSLNVSEFKSEIEVWDKILIDIRTQEELDTFGLIWEDALHLDIYKSDFSNELDKLDKNRKYLIYCAHWNRSKSALDMMAEKWFEYVKDLNGGIAAWINNWEEVFK